MPDDPYVSALQSLSERVRRLESQVSLTPVRYTVSGGGYLINSLSVGALTATLSTVPVWATAKTLIIVIDPGNVECEVRRLTALADTVCTFSVPLAYAHAENDPVLLISEPRLNVTWFGAIGDGVADDTVELNRALIQAGIVSPCEVYLAGTRYLISSSLNIPAAGYITLRGQTLSVPEIRTTSLLSAAMIQAIGSSSRGLTIENISFDGYSNAYYGIELSGYTTVSMRNCYFTQLDRDAVFINGTSTISSYISITGCSFYASILRHGIHILGYNRVAAVSIIGNMFYNCGSYSVYGESANHIVVVGNISSNAGSGNWNLAACTDTSITGNVPAV